MHAIDILYKAADVVERRGQPPKGQDCSGSQATDSEPICLVCALCIASGGRPGVIGDESVKDAMYELSQHLGLKLPGEVYDWDTSRRRASWYVADVLRACATKLAGERRVATNHTA